MSEFVPMSFVYQKGVKKDEGRDFTKHIKVLMDDGGEEALMDVTVEYAYNPNTYGNGYYCGINGTCRKGDECWTIHENLDLRYEHNFSRENYIQAVFSWLESYYISAYNMVKVEIIE